MEALSFISVFGTLTALTTVAGVRIWCRPAAAPPGVTDGEGDPFDAEAVAIPPSLARKVGKVLPASPKDADPMQRQLLRGGYWRPGAMKKVYALKAALGLTIPVAAAPLAARLELLQDRGWILAVTLAAAGFMLPNLALRYLARRRKKQILRSLPNALDLMVMCMDSGLAVNNAILEAARGLEHAHPELSRELALVTLEIRAGVDRKEALRHLGLRTGIRQMRDLAMTLIQSDRVRASVAQSLRSHSDHMRAISALELEEKAGKLGVKLTLPIFLCTLPSVLVVMVGPEFVRVFRDVMPVLKFPNFGG